MIAPARVQLFQAELQHLAEVLAELFEARALAVGARHSGDDAHVEFGLVVVLDVCCEVGHVGLPLVEPTEHGITARLEKDEQAMAAEEGGPENVVLLHLREMRNDLKRLKRDLGEVKREVIQLRGSVSAVRGDFARLEADLAMQFAERSEL